MISINSQQNSNYQQYSYNYLYNLNNLNSQDLKKMQEIVQNIKVESENNYYYEHNSQANGPFHIQKNTSEIYSSFIKSGHWAQKQKLRYGLFLIYFRQLLQKKQNRRLLRLFKSMSEFVKTRNPNQCRSHHQKMEKYFGSVTSIIDYFNDKHNDMEEKLNQNKEILQDIYLKFKNKLEDDHAEENQSENRFTKDQFLNLFQVSQNVEKRQLSQQINEKDKELPPTGTYYQPIQKPKQSSSNFMEKILNRKKQDMIPVYQNPYLKNYSAEANPYLSNLTGKNPYISNTSHMINPYHSNSLEMEIKSSQHGFQIQGTGEQRKKQKQWLQCHQYFIQWITRLNKLVNSPPKPYNY